MHILAFINTRANKLTNTQTKYLQWWSLGIMFLALNQATSVLTSSDLRRNKPNLWCLVSHSHHNSISSDLVRNTTSRTVNHTKRSHEITH